MTMDLNGLLRLVFLEKSDLTVGVLIGLTLLVVVLMLVRSVMEEKQASAAGSGAPVDAKALSLAVEGALKKALSETAAVKASGGLASGEAMSGDVEELTKTLRAREAKIAALMTDFETLKTQSEAKAGASAAPGVDNTGEFSALQAKIKELQAKLSEYEIIEDDIADLSIFKEENKKLKDEIEKLRAATLTAHAQVQSVQASVATPTPSVESIQAAQSAIVEPPRAAAEPFELDTDDAVMGEFAQAISASSTAAEVKPQTAIDEAALRAEAMPALVAPATPQEAEAPSPAELSVDAGEEDLFGPLDTEKMLAEVSSLGDDQADVSTSVLEDELDTDRLMAEMGMAEPVTPSTASDSPVDVTGIPATQPAAVVEAAAAAVGEAAPEAAGAAEAAKSAKTKPVIVEAPDSNSDQVPVDDLLAEFQDTDYPTLKGTKGS